MYVTLKDLRPGCLAVVQPYFNGIRYDSEYHRGSGDLVEDEFLLVLEALQERVGFKVEVEEEPPRKVVESHEPSPVSPRLYFALRRFVAHLICDLGTGRVLACAERQHKADLEDELSSAVDAILEVLDPGDGDDLEARSLLAGWGRNVPEEVEATFETLNDSTGSKQRQQQEGEEAGRAAVGWNFGGG